MMFDQTGARRQEALRKHPAVERSHNMDKVLRGIIMSVKFNDQNAAKQTLVDIRMNGGWPDLVNVPMMATKANSDNGEEWSPEPGDGVVVVFINGNAWEPIVIGYTHGPLNGIQGTSVQIPPGKRRYHLRCNKTDIVIDKDGTRTTYVAKDEILTVKGDGTIIIQEGSLSINVLAGAATVNVKGDATVHSDGNLTASAIGTATVSGAIVNLSSSGAVHITGSGTVSATGTGDMSLSSTSGNCTVSSGGTMNIQSSGNINMAGTGSVNISGANVSVSD